MTEQRLEFNGVLSAKRIHVDGTIEDLGIISGRKAGLTVAADPTRQSPWYVRLWSKLRRERKIPLAMSIATFVAYELHNHLGKELLSMPGLFGLVTSAGATYIAADFAAGGSSPHVGAFNDHDFGTGGDHGSTVSVSSVSNVGGQLQLTCGTAHGATTNDIWLVTGVVGTGMASPSTWQIQVISSTVIGIIGLTASGSYVPTSATIQLVNGAADTALTTAAGTSRVAGVQTTPSSGIYQSVATVSFTSSFSIVEWAIFSATTSGTMLDRRWFNTTNSPATPATGALIAAPITVTNGMGISMTYGLTINSGGS